MPSYQRLRKGARRLKLGKRTVLVAEIEDLIAMKAAASRPKDLRALDDLEAMRRLK